MFAAIDLGSNSFRLHVAHHDGQAFRVVKTAREPIKLAAGLDAQGRLSPEAQRAAIDCLARFRDIIGAYELDAVRVVATNTIRVAKNAAEFLPAAEKAIGYPIEIISGEEEGRLIYMGVACSLAGSSKDEKQRAERRLVIDIGGGSTELILGSGAAIEQVESFTIGTYRTSQDFFPDGRIDAAGFDAAITAARSRFEDGAAPYQPQFWQQAYGSSGTMRAISDAIAKNDLGDGALSRTSVEALKHRLISFGHTSRIVLTGMKPERASVIVGGLAILIGVMDELGIRSLTPVEAGLRMGVLWDLELRATKRDRRDAAVQALAERFKADAARGARAAELAASLFMQLKPSGETLLPYLCWSARLHEIGMLVSHSSYHKHGAYLVQNADLAGFTTREQGSMAGLVLAQKGNLKKAGEALENADFARAVLALRLAVMFMHSRIAVAADDVKLRMRGRIEMEVRREWLAAHPTLAVWLEKERQEWLQVGVEFGLKKS